MNHCRVSCAFRGRFNGGDNENGEGRGRMAGIIKRGKIRRRDGSVRIGGETGRIREGDENGRGLVSTKIRKVNRRVKRRGIFYNSANLYDVKIVFFVKFNGAVTGKILDFGSLTSTRANRFIRAKGNRYALDWTVISMGRRSVKKKEGRISRRRPRTRNFSYRADMRPEKYCNAHSLERSLMFRARADIASWTTPRHGEKAWLDAIFDPRDEIHCIHTHIRITPRISFSLSLSFQNRELVIRVSDGCEKPASFRTEIVNPRSSDPPRFDRDFLRYAGSAERQKANRIACFQR